MDFVGSLKGKSVLTKIDCFSKLVQLNVWNRADAFVVLVGLDRWTRKRDEIKTVITDGGSHFVKTEVRGMLIRMRGKHVMTLAYDHHSNGIIEICNKNVLHIIKKNMVGNPYFRWW